MCRWSSNSGCRFQSSDPDHVIGDSRRIHDDLIELGVRRSVGERGARGDVRSPPDDDALWGRRLQIRAADEGLRQRGRRHGDHGHQHGDPHTETRRLAKGLVECRHLFDPSVDIISAWIDPRAFFVDSDEVPDSETGQVCDAYHRLTFVLAGPGFASERWPDASVFPPVDPSRRPRRPSAPSSRTASRSKSTLRLTPRWSWICRPTSRSSTVSRSSRKSRTTGSATAISGAPRGGRRRRWRSMGPMQWRSHRLSSFSTAPTLKTTEFCLSAASTKVTRSGRSPSPVSPCNDRTTFCMIPPPIWSMCSTPAGPRFCGFRRLELMKRLSTSRRWLVGTRGESRWSMKNLPRRLHAGSCGRNRRLRHG